MSVPIYSFNFWWQVLINGRPGNVPTSAGDLKVEKFNDWITARGRGFSVSCSTIHDLCTVKVSGFYQGKTNGLLGTLNNENFDDMSSLDGNVGLPTSFMTKYMEKLQEIILLFRVRSLWQDSLNHGSLDSVKRGRSQLSLNRWRKKNAQMLSVEDRQRWGISKIGDTFN